MTPNARPATRRIRVGGRPLVVKTATGAGRAALRREADVLATLAGPGAVELVAVRETDDRTHLVTTDAETADLGDPTVPSSDAAVFIQLRQLADVVADLHDRGWVHGALCAEHVLAGDGGVRLCSWGSARPVGDPAATDAEVLDLRNVVVHRLGRHRPQRTWARLGWRRRERRALRALDALQPGSDARDVATVLAAEQHRGVGADLSAPRRRRPARASSLLCRGKERAGDALHAVTRPTGTTLTVLGLLALGGVVIGTSHPSDADPAAALVGEVTPEDVRHREAAAAQPCPGSPVPPVIDLDGDGCAGEVRLEGRMLVADGVTFEVGEDGDRPALGDWECDGILSVRVLRPGSGAVYEFAGWPDGAATGRLIASAPGATDLTVHSTDDCDRMVLLDATGQPVSPTDDQLAPPGP